MDYANGDSCTGEFKVSRGHKESLIAENPYARGEPNGKCSRTFSDGSFYEGEMKDGKVRRRAGNAQLLHAPRIKKSLN